MLAPGRLEPVKWAPDRIAPSSSGSPCLPWHRSFNATQPYQAPRLEFLVGATLSEVGFPPFTSSRHNMSFPEGVNSLPQDLP
jgi:hypothetical protein